MKPEAGSLKLESGIRKQEFRIQGGRASSHAAIQGVMSMLHRDVAETRRLFLLNVAPGDRVSGRSIAVRGVRGRTPSLGSEFRILDSPHY
jgi:hypothetical protein